MLDIKRLNVKKSLVADLYKVDTAIAEEWKKINKEEKKRILNFAEVKKDIISKNINVANNTMATSFFTHCLLYGELCKDKDVTMFTFEEILELIETMKLNEVFRSVSSAMSYFNLFAQCTKYAYYNGYRDDYYVINNFTEAVDINQLAETADVFTLEEMKKIIYEVYREDVQLTLLAALEGLKTTEVLNILREELLLLNHPLNVGERYVNLSDELYYAMQDYARIDMVIYPSTNATIARKLVDSPYLIRPCATKRGNNEPLAATTFNGAIKKDLKRVGFEHNVHCFRTNAMLYDLLELGLSVEEINKKYGTNFNHKANVCKDKSKVQIMDKKIHLIKQNLEKEIFG